MSLLAHTVALAGFFLLRSFIDDTQGKDIRYRDRRSVCDQLPTKTLEPGRADAFSLAHYEEELTVDLKAKTWALVTEDRIRTDYPVKRLNMIGQAHYITSKVAWDVLEKAFEEILTGIKRRGPEC